MINPSMNMIITQTSLVNNSKNKPSNKFNKFLNNNNLSKRLLIWV